MAVGIVPVNGGAPTFGRSYPDRVEFAFFDDGGGGTVIVNGGGIVGVGIVDLKTLFTSVGALFNSIPLLRAFRQLRVPGDANENCDRILSELQIVTNVLSTAVTNMAISYNVPTPGAQEWPAIALVGPGAVGTWRISIALRHSIPG